MADRASIRQTLLQFVQEDTAANATTIADETELRGGLGLDSVDFVGLIMRIEGYYRIRMTREELEGLATVGDLLTLVEAKITAAKSNSAAAA